MDTRRIIYLGSTVVMPARRAELLVQRGEAVFAETVPPAQPKSGPPETADVAPEAEVATGAKASERATKTRARKPETRK